MSRPQAMPTDPGFGGLPSASAQPGCRCRLSAGLAPAPGSRGQQVLSRGLVRYGIYGDLRLLVIIRQDGSLEDISVLSSSGYAVLDEAAIKIVRMAAPYAPFPPS